MTEKDIRNRITELRIKKDVSEYKMSLDLGHSKGYIQGISSGRTMPSMTEFLAICEYLEVTPQDFFNEENKNPALVSKITDKLQRLDDGDLKLVLDMVEMFKKWIYFLSEAEYNWNLFNC